MEPTLSTYPINATMVGYSFQTFKFLNYSFVFLHCSVIVCDQSETSAQCERACNPDQTSGRKRRDTIGRQSSGSSDNDVIVKRKRRSVIEQSVDLLQPIIIVLPTDELPIESQKGLTSPVITSQFYNRNSTTPTNTPKTSNSNTPATSTTTIPSTTITPIEVIKSTSSGWSTLVKQSFIVVGSNKLAVKNKKLVLNYYTHMCV